MVRRAASQIFLFILTVTLVAESPPPKASSDYKIGETAAEDIITPFSLIVIDRDATEQLREQEAQRIPVIFLFNSRAADEAEADFYSALADLQGQFLDALAAVFHRRELDDQATDSSQFKEFVSSFLAANSSFPADEKYLARWAGGEPDRAITGPVAAKLRGLMERCIRPESLPVGVTSSSRARIVTITDPREMPLLESVERQSVETSRNNIPTLTRVRNDFISAFSPPEEAIARFAAGFLRENCVPSAELTRQYRAKATDSIFSADHYEAGQVIVKRGEAITAKTKAALDELVRKMNIGRFQSTVANHVHAAVSNERSRGLLVALAAVLILSGFTIWRLSAQRPAVVSPQLPARIVGAEPGGMVIACPTCAEHIAIPFGSGESGEGLVCGHHSADHEFWKQRALLAERRAGQAAAIVRTGLISQLSRYLTAGLLKKLVSQREDLLQTQQKAAVRMAAAEQQLLKAGGNWQSWRRLYENRIAELEKELEVKGEENRALIRTKIAIARRQLEAVEKETRWN